MSEARYVQRLSRFVEDKMVQMPDAVADRCDPKEFRRENQRRIGNIPVDLKVLPGGEFEMVTYNCNGQMETDYEEVEHEIWKPTPFSEGLEQDKESILSTTRGPELNRQVRTLKAKVRKEALSNTPSPRSSSSPPMRRVGKILTYTDGRTEYA